MKINDLGEPFICRCGAEMIASWPSSSQLILKCPECTMTCEVNLVVIDGEVDERKSKYRVKGEGSTADIVAYVVFLGIITLMIVSTMLRIKS